MMDVEEKLDVVTVMELPIVNDSTRILIHDRDPVGIVCGTCHSENLYFYYACLIDSFTWLGNGMNELHIFLAN